MRVNPSLGIKCHERHKWLNEHKGDVLDNAGNGKGDDEDGDSSRVD